MVDLLLQGGTVLDGSGAEPVEADVSVRGDVIASVTKRDGTQQNEAGFHKVIDCRGLVICPGFIDIHTHSDFSILTNGDMASSLCQGVTTEVVGNCGISIGMMQDLPAFAQERRWAERGGLSITWSRMSEWFSRVEDSGIACNVASLVGHGTIRKLVMGLDDRPASSSDLRLMRQKIEQGLEDGAAGFSTGLEYVPSGYADVAEQADLAAVLRGSSRFYATHIRNEGDTLVESVQEALDASRLAGVPLQLSHHKCEGRANWGKIATTLAMMDAARDNGQDVLTDQYPYSAFMTGLPVIALPRWVNEGSPDEVVARLTSPTSRPGIADEIRRRNLDWDNIRIGNARNNRALQGQSLADVARSQGRDPVDTVIELIIAENTAISAINFAMSEDEIEAVLRDPHTMIGSDGVSQTFGGILADDNTHPRSFGTFPRVFARYVRERAVISLEEAVRRATSLPAQRVGLTDRGRIAEGFKADITVMAPESIQDTATFDQPHQKPVGVHHVLVNGALAIHFGEPTPERAGRVLRMR